MADWQPTRVLVSLTVPFVGGCETCSPLIFSSGKLFLLKLSCSWGTSYARGHVLWSALDQLRKPTCLESALRSNQTPSLTISCFKSALSAGFLIKLGKHKALHKLRFKIRLKLCHVGCTALVWWQHLIIASGASQTEMGACNSLLWVPQL